MSIIQDNNEPEKYDAGTVVRLQASYHEGILPSPEQLEKYASAHPDAVKTILEMAVRQQEIDFEIQKARQDRLTAIGRENFNLANKRIENNARFAKQGQWFALILMLCFFVLLGYMVTVHPSNTIAVGFLVPVIAAIGQIIFMFMNHKKPPKPQ